MTRFTSRSASGPLTSTVRSTPTSQRVTPSLSAWYSRVRVVVVRRQVHVVVDVVGSAPGLQRGLKHGGAPIPGPEEQAGGSVEGGVDDLFGGHVPDPFTVGQVQYPAN